MNSEVLLVDDEPATLFGVTRFMTRAGYLVSEATTLAEAKDKMASMHFDAVILDLNLPDGNGIDWIQDIREIYPAMAIVVVTGTAAIPLAVEAMRRGADNFLTKPINPGELDIFLRKSLELGSLRRKDLTHKWLSKKFQVYFGESDAIRKVIELATIAQENDSAVLLQGETGSGKGVLAKWIYHGSDYKSGPFVEINCSGLRGDLLASELFGHAKGAFTSAVQEKAGLIEAADGGTLFLDEIADMDLAVQAQFLKVIEEKSFRRLGDIRARRSNFRLVTATNKDLEEETRHGRFRKDLFFRVNVFPIHIPSLRERPDDLDGLISHILGSLGAPLTGVSPGVLALLKSYYWPGNVRELRNVLERALLLARGLPLTQDHFPGITLSALPSKGARSGGESIRPEDDRIKALLKEMNGDIKKAAEAMGISRATLYRRIKIMRSRQ